MFNKKRSMLSPKCTADLSSTTITILDNFTLHILKFMQVTTKGTGLNPNAKVWQEIPSHQDDVPEWTEDTTWLLTYPPTAMISEGTDFWWQIMSTSDSGIQHRRLVLLHS